MVPSRRSTTPSPAWSRARTLARLRELAADAPAAALFARVTAADVSPADAELFRAQMLTEMAAMSIDDGLVMQIHPGSFRNHNGQLFASVGRDKGADIPTRTDYVSALKPLLDRFGNRTDLSIILFTLDESTYARELAPLAGHYPVLRLGPAWWFHDSPEGMRRFRRSMTETAGFCNTVGFNDDTRAFLSIPARHDVARRRGIAAAASFPLTTSKACTAVLLFYSTEKHPFDDEIVGLLQSMADNVSFALENFHREEQRKTAETILRESEERFRSLTQLSSDFYWEQDSKLRFTKYEGKIVGDSNTRAVAELIGNHLWNMSSLTPSSNSWEQFRLTLSRHERFRDFEFSFRNADQVVYHMSLSGEPIFDEQSRFMGYRGIARDVSERKRISDHIKYLATHDHLTGLPNRVMFTELLEQATRLAARYSNRAFALFFIDLDRFKLINDTYGHHMGDALLREVALRLRIPLRASDVVARLGGDEFVILLQELTDHRKIGKVAQNVLNAFAQPIIIQDTECRITVSIGISIYGVDALDEETLMKHADAAMYVAKEEGKDNFQFYSHSLHERTQGKLDLEVNLRNALKRNELTLHYQPKLDLRSGMIVGVEVLLRWHSPQLGNIAPDTFIPIAEESGMILPIGEWVLMTACRQAAAWQEQGLFPFCVAVNLSARQFNDPELLAKVRAALDHTGMSAHRLELEITESLILNHPHRAMKLLQEIKALGLKLALDDFGTGYSSLGQLKHYPIDTLKIDRSLIQEIPADEHDSAITKALISMGRTLGLTVVAEGVETREQLDFLREQDCPQIQGYFFQRPLPADEFLNWCKSHDPQQFLQCPQG